LCRAVFLGKNGVDAPISLYTHAEFALGQRFRGRNLRRQLPNGNRRRITRTSCTRGIYERVRQQPEDDWIEEPLDLPFRIGFATSGSWRNGLGKQIRLGATAGWSNRTARLYIPHYRHQQTAAVGSAWRPCSDGTRGCAAYRWNAVAGAPAAGIEYYAAEVFGSFRQSGAACQEGLQRCGKSIERGVECAGRLERRNML